MVGSRFSVYCATGLCVRLLLIMYANYHDRTFSVAYTDVDYRVYTDAARLIVNGQSPYNRHTYRYTPLLAAILTPNVFTIPDFGKILFSLIDVLVTILTRTILLGSCTARKAEIFALAWLFNPLTIVVTTRGNADSLAVLLVLWTLYHLRRDEPMMAGLVHGLSIHFRLYPIVFSLSMYLSLRGKNVLYPNANQAKLVLSCMFSLVLLTAVCYWFYGYAYLFESMLYHLVRKDPRHNFSVFFYATYLSTGQPSDVLKSHVLLTSLPQLIVLVALSFRYSNKTELQFSMFTQAMVMVIYNQVMTTQYFFWFLSLLPVCMPDLRISWRRWLALTTLWLLAQILWLFDAYSLEFTGVNTFVRIWIDGLLFFVANLKILHDVITHYDRGLATKSD